MSDKLQALIDAGKHMKREIEEDYMPRTGMVSFGLAEFDAALAAYEEQGTEIDRFLVDRPKLYQCVRAWHCTYGSGIDPEQLAALFELTMQAGDDMRAMRDLDAFDLLTKIVIAAERCRIKKEVE